MSNIIDRCIKIIDKEVGLMEKKPELTNQEAIKLVDYVKTLLTVDKERRSMKDEDLEGKSDKELEEEILKEADKIKKARKDAK